MLIMIEMGHRQNDLERLRPQLQAVLRKELAGCGQNRWVSRMKLT